MVGLNVMAKEQNERYWKVIAEHLGIAIIVIVTTYYVGSWISVAFG